MVTGTTGATGVYGTSSYAPAPKELDREAFLKLLITELQHQDPMKPMDDKDFIAQLAQFSSLEQMQRLNSNMDPFIQGFGIYAGRQEALSAASWLGRTVSATDPNPPTDPVTGKKVDRTLTAAVESVQFQDGEPLLRIKFTEEVKDTTTGEMVDVERTRDIPLAYVLSVH